MLAASICSRSRRSARDRRDLTVPRGIAERFGRFLARRGRGSSGSRSPAGLPRSSLLTIAAAGARARRAAAAVSRRLARAGGPTARSASAAWRPAWRRRFRASLVTIAEQPGAERRSLAEARQRLPCLHEALLCGVLGLGRRARDEVCRPERDVLVFSHEIGVRGCVYRDRLTEPAATDPMAREREDPEPGAGESPPWDGAGSAGEAEAFVAGVVWARPMPTRIGSDISGPIQRCLRASRSSTGPCLGTRPSRRRFRSGRSLLARTRTTRPDSERNVTERVLADDGLRPAVGPSGPSSPSP